MGPYTIIIIRNPQNSIGIYTKAPIVFAQLLRMAPTMECAAAVPGPVVAGLVRLVEELLRGFEIYLDPKELAFSGFRSLL